VRTSALRSTQGRRAFILANTTLSRPSLVPEIRLHLASEAHELWLKTEGELVAAGLDLETEPPFWAFAWAGGQGLARHLLDHPDIVAGKQVLDIATGGGIVAIAAALAGAACVRANDIDPYCEAAVELNAAANCATIEFLAGDLTSGDLPVADVAVAGDIAYDRAMTPPIFGLLARLAASGAAVLVGDPGRAYLPRERLVQVAEYRVPVPQALEDSEVKTCRVWRLRA
jgi:predicted nicotinamide N-methyase